MVRDTQPGGYGVRMRTYQIAVWFWPEDAPHGTIPDAVAAPANNSAPPFVDTGDASMMSKWGKPDAFFGASGEDATCPMDKFFAKHEIIFDIT